MKSRFSPWLRTTSMCLLGVLFGVILFSRFPILYGKVEYVDTDTQSASLAGDGVPLEPASAESVVQVAEMSPQPVSHISTPNPLKSIYMSSWVAGSLKHRTPLIDLVSSTELNAIVIDVKDSTGRISFPVIDPNLQNIGSVEKRITDIDALIKELHSKNIYVIGRVAVFQDPYLTKKNPQWAITRLSDGGVWTDRKGLSFLDPTKKEVWEYIVRIGHEAYARGFDEINFDYIRYPSDGNMSDINYNLTTGHTRSDNLEIFFTYLSHEMKKDYPIPISADLFGLTTEARDDMGIGQVWEKALPHFDYLSPMVYPSHYPHGHAGYKNPALYPYEVINRALKGAIEKTISIHGDVNKIRPWLQDFNLGAIYTNDLVRAQMKAVYDNNLTSWMLWDPSNHYTPDALILESTH